MTLRASVPGASLALASLSGVSDADWARRGAKYADWAFLGGVSLDEPTRTAARDLIDRGRDEFVPADPLAFVDAQLSALADVPIRAGVNVRAVSAEPIAEAARVCASHDAILEVNAHCRQDEVCAVGAGESLLRDADRLTRSVTAAAGAGATVSVKVRVGVVDDLPGLAADCAVAGARLIHVDAMDSEAEIGAVVDAVPDECVVVANNGVRDAETVEEYLALGAGAVSVGRPSTDPRVLSRVRKAVDRWNERERPAV